MRYLILSDLHANLPALEAVLADASALGYDQVLVLGDLVGYGADPAAVMDLTLSLDPAALIRGNHDKVCAGLESAEFFNDAARAAAEWTAATLDAAHLAVLASLPRGPRLVGDTIEICHGAPFDEDFYVFDEDDASRAAESAGARICLFGHTHVPAVFSAPQDPVRSSGGPDDEFALVAPARGKTGILEQAGEGVLRFVPAGDLGRLHLAQFVEGEQDLEFRLLGKGQQGVGGRLRG